MRNIQCTKCERHKYAKNVCVWGNTVLSSTKEIMVIIDTVTSNTNESGIVTSGQGGNILIKLFNKAGILDKVYFTSAVKCYNSKNPTIKEVRACQDYIKQEIAEIKPKLIITLGIKAAQSVFGKANAIKNLRRRIFGNDNIKVGCTYSHNTIFTSPTIYEEIKDDIVWILNNYKEQKAESYEIKVNDPNIPIVNAYGFDIETTSLSPFSGEILTISLSPVGSNTAYVYNINHPKNTKIDTNFLQSIFSSSSTFLIGHSIKFDIKYVISKFFPVNCKLIDVAICHALLNENSNDNSLKGLSATYTAFGHYEDDIDRKNLANEDFDKVAKYNGLDSIVPYHLFKIFWPKLIEEGTAQIASFLFEMLPIFVEIELTGIYVNINKLKVLYDEAQRKISELRMKHPKYDFNKTEHISTLLFKEADITKVKLTKTGKASTDKDTLNTIKFLELDEYQRSILNDVVLFRDTISDIKRITGGKQGKQGIVPNIIDNRLHTTYNLARSIDDSDDLKGTVTGRLSSSNPPLQNIPTASKMRAVFEVTPNWKYIVSPDYSQIELRVAAFLSREPVFLKAFNEGYDIHTSVMCDLIHEDYNYVQPILESKQPADKYQTFHDYRLVIKRVNFGILYQIWIDKLIKVIRQMNINLTDNEAKDLIDKWYAKHTKLLSWVHQTENEIIKNGKIKTIFGRIRHLEGANRKDQFGKRMLRQGINFPIQSAASDITLIAINELYKAFRDKNLNRLLLTVHDQVMFETQIENIDLLKDTVKHIMEKQVVQIMLERFNIDFDVPLTVDVYIGKEWK